MLATEALELLLLPLPLPELPLVVAGATTDVVNAEPDAVGDELELEILPPGSIVADIEVVPVY